MLSNSNGLIGQTLGTCTLQRLLGRGGMGAVYLAQQSRPRRIVAVKVLLPGLVEQRPRDEFLTRFRREADAIAALDHVNIMPIYEYGEQNEFAYLVMPYVRGGTLRERLEKRSILPLDEVIQIIEQTAAGLDSAHRQGIIHRDLKPGNILFHADSRILIADFGLAKMLNDTSDTDAMSVLTSIGTIVGTPEYLSPEQSTGTTLSTRTDIYSLGVVLYQMLAGRVPFSGSSPVAIAIKHTMEEPPLITTFNEQIPRSVEAVVMKALAKAPEQRFGSASELARALRIAASEEHTTHVWQLPTQENIASAIPAAHNPSKTELSTSETELEQAGQEPATTNPPATPELISATPVQAEEDIHAAPTEESPRLPAQPDREAELPTFIKAADETIADKAQLQKQATAAKQARPVKGNRHREQAAAFKQEQQVMRPPEQLQRLNEQQQHNYQPQRARAGCQSAWMMLVGSLLTLLLLGGGIAAYLHFNPLQTGHPPTATTHPGKTPTPASTPSQPAVGNVLPTAPATVPVGTLLYGTSQPATCDKQGAHWSSSKDAKITCSSDGARAVNDGSQSSHIAGVFLDQIPDKQIPNNFVLQAQITVNPGSRGPFGLYYHNQAGAQQQGAYSFLIDPSDDSWSAYVYDNTTGANNALTSHVPIQTKAAGTLTIDVVVQGTSYRFFVNGTDVGNAESGGQYTGGTVGLAVGPGADITYKSLAIYTGP